MWRENREKFKMHELELERYPNRLDSYPWRSAEENWEFIMFCCLNVDCLALATWVYIRRLEVTLWITFNSKITYDIHVPKQQTEPADRLGGCRSTPFWSRILSS
jgi:hypothetical protein